MMIGWSDLQTSKDSAQPSAYELAAAVNKSVGRRYEWEHRQPVPEVLHGNPTVVQSAIHALPFKCKYRVATLAFTQQDVDVAAFNNGDQELRLHIAAAVEIFLEMALSGIPEGCRPPILIGTHTHTGSLEVNIVMPRYVQNSVGEVRSYNPHSPMRGSTLHWDALRDLLNSHFGWRNPKDGPEAPVIRGPNWAEKKLANIARLGQDIDPKSDPKLFLLSKAKQLLATPQDSTGPTRFAQLKSVAADLGFTTNYPDKGKLVFSDPGQGHRLHIRLVVPLREDAAPSRTADHLVRLSSRWQRRAAWNAKKFSKDTWIATEPDWASILNTPTLKIPECHPDYVTIEPTEKPLRLPLWALLRLQLRTLARKLSRQMFETSILRQISNLPTMPFHTLANSLETTSHDYDRNFAFSRPVNGRTLQPSTAGVGPDFPSRSREPFFRTDVRDHANKQSNGTAQQRANASDPKRRHQRSDPRATDSDARPTEFVEAGCRLDLTDPRVAGISTGELIRAALIAANGQCRSIRRLPSGVIEVDVGTGQIRVLPSAEISAHGDPLVIQDFMNAFAMNILVVANTYLNTGNDGPFPSMLDVR